MIKYEMREVYIHTNYNSSKEVEIVGTKRKK